MATDYALVPRYELETIARLSLALLVGAAIGWERQSEHKPAGLRTHMLVSLGAALFVLVGLQTGDSRSSAEYTSRVLQGIVSGVGFLGAGEIFSKSRVASESGDRNVKVHGLTSAAAIWVSAALGAACGCGLWVTGIAGAVMAVLVLWGVKKIE